VKGGENLRKIKNRMGEYDDRGEPFPGQAKSYLISQNRAGGTGVQTANLRALGHVNGEQGSPRGKGLEKCRRYTAIGGEMRRGENNEATWRGTHENSDGNQRFAAAGIERR